MGIQFTPLVLGFLVRTYFLWTIIFWELYWHYMYNNFLTYKLFSTYDRWRNRRSKRSVCIPKVTQPRNVRASIWSQIWEQNSCFELLSDLKEACHFSTGVLHHLVLPWLLIPTLIVSTDPLTATFSLLTFPHLQNSFLPQWSYSWFNFPHLFTHIYLSQSLYLYGLSLPTFWLLIQWSFAPLNSFHVHYLYHHLLFYCSWKCLHYLLVHCK